MLCSNIRKSFYLNRQCYSNRFDILEPADKKNGCYVIFITSLLNSMFYFAPEEILSLHDSHWEC